jgi:hypothetical protein
LAPDAEGKDRRQQRGRQRDHAGHVDTARAGALAVGGQHAQAERKRGAADRDVDQEDRSPAAADDVGEHEHAAEDLAAHRPGGGRDRVEAECAGALRSVELDLDGAEDLGHHERRARALHDSRRDQDDRVRGQAAGQRRGAEGRQAKEENAPVAEHLAEPRARDQQHRVGEQVPAEDELELGAGRADVGMDRGRGDIDDGDVELRHEHRRQPDREGPALGRAYGDSHLPQPTRAGRTA